MTTPHDRRLEELFEAAIDLPVGQRAAYVASHCGDDRGLRAELESLLIHDAERGESFLSAPAVLLARGLGRLEEGTEIAGRYTIKSLLGEGGMGLVYLAEQTKPVKRQVAVKLVKLGMDTREVLARFESERQALAMLNHPNIATVLDAGVTGDGRPFFVMEYVDGVPINAFCDGHRLSVDERLELIERACEAIQHAHHNGIIHRDVKPSNILVTETAERPELKIIDFGIAKAVRTSLTERTLETIQGQFIGTPQYMSPEQAQGNADGLDTRADVYALGVLLYELLAGSTPFEHTTYNMASLEEVRRRICQDEPPRPSARVSHLDSDRKALVAECRQTSPMALMRALRGDLDWIVMKAIDKDRERRYESAAAFAEDVRRCQRHEPVTAGPPGVLYTSGKFMRRHRPLVIGAAVVALTLIAGIVGTAIFAIGEAQANERLQSQERVTAAVNEVLLEILNAPDPRRLSSPADVARDVTVREAVLAVTETIDDRLGEDDVVAAAVHNMLGQTFLNLSEYERAEHHLERALQLRQDRFGNDALPTLDTVHLIVVLYTRCGRYDEALELAQHAYDVRRRIAPDAINTTTAMVDLADIVKATGDYARSEALYLEAIRRDEEQGIVDQNSISITNSLGVNLMAQGRYAEAEPYIREAIHQMTELAGEDHSDTLDFRDNLATILMREKRYEEVEPILLDIIEDSMRTLGPRNRGTLVSRMTLANTYRRLKRFEEANAIFEEIVPISTKAMGADNPLTLSINNNYAVCCRDQGRYDQAGAIFERSLEILKQRWDTGHPEVLVCQGNLARVRVFQERFEDAETLATTVFEGFLEAYGDQHPRTQVSMRILRDVYTAWGKPQEAAIWQEQLDALMADR